MTKITTKTVEFFNRSVLDMSFTLLRNKDPKLALLIRNILFNVTVTKSKQAPDNKKADLFKINLKLSQVTSIVENLNQVLEESQKIDPTKNTSIFRPVIIESILKEWNNLACFLKSN